MQLGRRHRLALGFGLIMGAIVVAAIAPHGDPDVQRSLGLSDAVIDPVDGSGTRDEKGGSLTATVSWPSDAADLDRSDICVVLIDDSGGVSGEGGASLEPIPGEPDAARWTVDGLAEGRYTIYVAQCLTPAPDRQVWVEPQFLGGTGEVEAASWIEVEDGTAVDVGTIALHRTGLETWPEGS